VSLEEEIIEWSTSRPVWQREVLKKVASGQILSDKDYDSLVDRLLSPSQSPAANFGLTDFPQVNVGDPAVTLISVSQPEHVNALNSDKSLTFGETGLTIIYGDNASGKSGYARLLKRIARSRHREDVLSDVFRDTALSRPKAAFTLRVGSKDVSSIWPESTAPELQRLLFYDGECGKAYVVAEADFPYRPAALFVMDGLIEACIAIRTRLDTKLEENGRSAKVLPTVDEDIRNTDGGKYLAELSGNSSVEFLAEVDRRLNESGESVTELRARS
jgi:energy-coupling factor transporter ATP-binding protein EcfA2